MRPRPADIVLGACVAPVAVLVALGAVYALRPEGTDVTDLALVALVAWPTLLALLLVAVPRLRPRALGWAAGAALGTVVVIGGVLLLVSGLAWILSDPG